MIYYKTIHYISVSISFIEERGIWLKGVTTSECPAGVQTSVSETYVCAQCEAAVERNFEVRSLIRTCEECDQNGRFLHRSLVESLSKIAAEDRPDGWEQMALDERFEAALQQGLITITRK